jgi:hypothetical protein
MHDHEKGGGNVHQVQIFTVSSKHMDTISCIPQFAGWTQVVASDGDAFRRRLEAAHVKVPNIDRAVRVVLELVKRVLQCEADKNQAIITKNNEHQSACGEDPCGGLLVIEV